MNAYVHSKPWLCVMCMMNIEADRNNFFRKPFHWRSSGSELCNNVPQNYWSNLGFGLDTYSSNIILNYKLLNFSISGLIWVGQYNNSAFPIIIINLFTKTLMPHSPTEFFIILINLIEYLLQAFIILPKYRIILLSWIYLFKILVIFYVRWD